MTTNTQKKIGLVVEGGGMKCAYNAAILDAFLDHNITLLTALARLAGLETWPAIWPDNGAEIFAFLQSIFTAPVILG